MFMLHCVANLENAMSEILNNFAQHVRGCGKENMKHGNISQ